LSQNLALSALGYLTTPGPVSSPKASYLVQYLRELAPWILKSEWLEAADRVPSWLQQEIRRTPGERLHRKVGCCHILFVLEDDDFERLEQMPLRSSLLLPFRWIRQEDTPPCQQALSLPESVQQLAESVLSHFEFTRSEDEKEEPPLSETWRLVVDARTEAKLSELPLSISADSGWGALAVGLMLARQGVPSSSDCLISAAWDDREGFRSVRFLSKKLGLAEEFDCSLYVAGTQQLDGLSPENYASLRRLQVFAPPRPEDRPRAEQLLSRILSEFQIRPTLEEQGLDACIRYANQLVNRNLWSEYIAEQLTPTLAESCRQREKLNSEGGGLVLLGNNLSLNLLSLLIHRPDHCLVLHSNDKAHLAGIEDLQRYQQLHLPSCTLHLKAVDNNVEDEVVQQHLLEFAERALKNKPPVVDATGGFAAMKLPATLLASEQQWPLCYIHSPIRGKRPLSGVGIGHEELRWLSRPFDSVPSLLSTQPTSHRSLS
jgi:hypothetical protein